MALKSSKPILIAAAATVAAAGISGYAWYQHQRPPVLEIYVFALKSGRSIFIRTPDDMRTLIDGGANSEVIRHLTSILPFYSRRIDTIISTNTDPKYVSGLIDVANRYSISQVYVPKYTRENIGISTTTDDRTYKIFLDTLEKHEVKLLEASAGQVINVGKGINTHILFPVAPEYFEYSRASPPEMLLHITYGATSVLVLGDASTKVQNYLASSDSVSQMPEVDITGADALILSQAAVADTLSRTFMDLVRPTYVIHEQAPPRSGSTRSSQKPKPDPLAAILKDHRHNLKTDGSVRIISDGKHLQIERPDKRGDSTSTK